MTPPEPWLATFVTRWHSGASSPWLAHTQDRIGGHSGRMGVLCLHLWPGCSRDLLAACLTHDLGEYGSADVPFHAKADPIMRATLERLETAALERMDMDSPPLRELDALRLKFVDRLDAYLWAQHHAPQIIGRWDWQEDLRKLRELAAVVEVSL